MGGREGGREREKASVREIETKTETDTMPDRETDPTSRLIH